MPRDTKAEYRRRIERGLAQGLTRSQARGHARVGEGAKSSDGRSAERLAKAIRRFLKTGDFKASAKAEQVAPERMRQALYADELVKRGGSRLQRVRREMLVPTRGRVRKLHLGASAASRAGEFDNAVKKFRGKPDRLLLAPFEGEGVKDLQGRFHPFETDPNTLYELAQMEGGSFEQVYRLVTIT